MTFASPFSPPQLSPIQQKIKEEEAEKKEPHKTKLPNQTQKIPPTTQHPKDQEIKKKSEKPRYKKPRNLFLSTGPPSTLLPFFFHISNSSPSNPQNPKTFKTLSLTHT